MQAGSLHGNKRHGLSEAGTMMVSPAGCGTGGPRLCPLALDEAGEKRAGKQHLCSAKRERNCRQAARVPSNGAHAGPWCGGVACSLAGAPSFLSWQRVNAARTQGAPGGRARFCGHTGPPPCLQQPNRGPRGATLPAAAGPALWHLPHPLWLRARAAIGTPGAARLPSHPRVSHRGLHS